MIASIASSQTEDATSKSIGEGVPKESDGSLVPEFIVKRPGLTLAAAVAVGLTMGWLVKRRWS